MRLRYGTDAVVKFHYHETDEEVIGVTHFTTLNFQTMWISSIVRFERHTGLRNRFVPRRVFAT